MKFIDYDLDIKFYPDMPVKLVDEREFELHKTKYNYSKKLIKDVVDASVKVRKLINLNEQYFDEDVVNTYVVDLIKNKLLAKKFEF